MVKKLLLRRMCILPDEFERTKSISCFLKDFKILHFVSESVEYGKKDF